VIVGQSILEFRREEEEGAEKSQKRFGFVQTFDEKPRRRQFEVLKSQGMAMNQKVVFLSDGGDDVRQVQQYLSPEAEYWLGWFHITMRITVMKQLAKGLAKEGQGPIERDSKLAVVRKEKGIEKELQSLKWNLWRALPVWGANLDGVCGINGEPSGEQAHGEEAADGLDGTRGALLITGKDTAVEWGPGRDVPSLVSAVPLRAATATEVGRLTSPGF
jgi:hypothetical protein